MKFKAGDPVWADTNRPDFCMVGRKAATVVTAISCLLGETEYAIEIHDYPSPAPNGLWHGEEAYLSPRRDDGRDVTQWDEELWKPSLTNIGANT